jgi:hypothetical protein
MMKERAAKSRKIARLLMVGVKPLFALPSAALGYPRPLGWIRRRVVLPALERFACFFVRFPFHFVAP